MSKGHKRKHNNKLEHRRQSFITEQQLLILILVILVFKNRPKPIYSYADKCKYCCNDKCKYNNSYNNIYSNTDDFGYSGGGEYNYNEVKEEIEDENLKSYSFEESLYSTESELQLDEAPAKDLENKDDIEDGNSDVNNSENKSTIVDHAITEPLEKTIQEAPKEKTIITSSKINACSTTILQCCPKDNIEENLSLEPVVSKIPVVISQTELEIPIETLSIFPEPVYQIKTVDKKVFLDSCQLIFGSDKIFVKGFIQEDIEYCSADCVNPTAINGNIKKVTFNIPFQCSSKIVFNIEPQIFSSYGTLDLHVIDPSTNNISLYEKSHGNIDILNEKVFAELDSSKILQRDIQEEIKPLDNKAEEIYTFERMRKKIILHLKLNLLQNQKIFIQPESF